MEYGSVSAILGILDDAIKGLIGPVANGATRGGATTGQSADQEEAEEAEEAGDTEGS